MATETVTSIEAAEQAVAEAEAAFVAADRAYADAMAVAGPLRQARAAAQLRFAAAQHALELAQRGEPLTWQKVAAVLKKAGFTQGKQEYDRLRAWTTEGFGTRQRDGWTVELCHLWEFSVHRERNEAARARRAALLPKYRAALEAAGYAVEPAEDKLLVTRRPPEGTPNA
jgi:hypothetical protein